MKKFIELTTRWRALHGHKGFKRLLVNRETWLLATAILRTLVWIIRFLHQIM